MPGSFRIGKLAGIEISIHVCWLLIVVLLTWSLAAGWFPALSSGWTPFICWVIGLLATLLLFASVLAPELAHALIARARGLPVKNITLFVHLRWCLQHRARAKESRSRVPNGFRWSTDEPVDWRAGVSAPIPPKGRNLPVGDHPGNPCGIECAAGNFQSRASFPLDGGRVLRSIVWKISGNVRTAPRVATLSGQGIASLLILAGFWLIFGGDILDGIWFGLIGWFLLSGAQSANSQSMLETMLKEVKVGEVMNISSATTRAKISLQKLVDELLLPHGWRNAIVIQGEQPAGLITLGDIRHIPRDEWGQTSVGHAMIPLERLHIVSPGRA